VSLIKQFAHCRCIPIVLTSPPRKFLCERLDFIHIYGLKKLMFLYKLTGINNDCLKVCLRVYRRSSEFISMYSEFDIDLCHCGVIKSHVFSHFYAVVDRRRQWCFDVLCILFFLFCIYIYIYIYIYIIFNCCHLANKLYHKSYIPFNPLLVILY